MSLCQAGACRSVFAVLLLAAGWRSAPAAEPATFVTGEALRRTLADPIGASWSGRTFRDALEAISRNTQVSIVLDRRVDPSSSVEWSAPALPVGQLIDELAALHGAQIAWIGPTALVTAKANVGGIAQALAERQAETAAWPVDLRTAAAVRRPLAWNDLAEPRGMLEALAAEAGLRWTNLDTVPFDLLYHVTTPPLSLVERLSLATAGFGQTYRIDAAARTITPVPLPAGAVSSTSVTTPSLKPKPPVAIPKSSPPGTQVYTLTIKDVPLAKLVEVLRVKHGLKIRFDDEALRAANLTTDRLTSVDAKSATLEAMLEQAAAPLGMTARRDGDTVVIGPKK